MRKSGLAQGAVLLFGIGLLAALASGVGWEALLARLTRARPGWLAAACGTGILLRLTRAQLWNFYHRAAGYRAGRWQSLQALLGGDFLGTFFLGTLGSAARPLLMRLAARDAGIAASTESVIAEQYFTLVSHVLVLVVGGVTLVALPGFASSAALPVFAVAAVYGAAVTLTALAVAWGQAAGERLSPLLRWFPEGALRRLRRAAELLLQSRERLTGLLFGREVVLKGLGTQIAINTVLTAINSYCLLLALDVDFPPPLLLVVPTMYLTMANLPLSPSGIGIVEGYGLLLLTQLGVSGDAALSFLVLERLLGTVLTLVMGGLAILSLGIGRVRGATRMSVV